MRLRWQPSVRVAPPYFEDPVYIEAIASSVRGFLAERAFVPEAMIASFHGMPQKYLDAGDPYHCQCQKTSRLVRDRLGWAAERWHTTFQSRFGSDSRAVGHEQRPSSFDSGRNAHPLRHRG